MPGYERSRSFIESLFGVTDTYSRQAMDADPMIAATQEMSYALPVFGRRYGQLVSSSAVVGRNSAIQLSTTRLDGIWLLDAFASGQAVTVSMPSETLALANSVEIGASERSFSADFGRETLQNVGVILAVGDLASSVAPDSLTILATSTTMGSRGMANLWIPPLVVVTFIGQTQNLTLFMGLHIAIGK